MGDSAREMWPGGTPQVGAETVGAVGRKCSVVAQSPEDRDGSQQK